MQSLDVDSPQSPRAPDAPATSTDSALQVPRAPETTPRSPMRTPNSECFGASRQQQQQEQEVVRPTNLALSKTTGSGASEEPSVSMKPAMRFKRVVKSLQAKRAEARAKPSATDGAAASSSSSAAAAMAKAAEAAGSSERSGSKHAGSDDSGNFLRRFSKFYHTRFRLTTCHIRHQTSTRHSYIRHHTTTRSVVTRRQPTNYTRHPLTHQHLSDMFVVRQNVNILRHEISRGCKFSSAST